MLHENNALSDNNNSRKLYILVRDGPIHDKCQVRLTSRDSASGKQVEYLNASCTSDTYGDREVIHYTSHTDFDEIDMHWETAYRLDDEHFPHKPPELRKAVIGIVSNRATLQLKRAG